MSLLRHIFNLGRKRAYHGRISLSNASKIIENSTSKIRFSYWCRFARLGADCNDVNISNKDLECPKIAEEVAQFIRDYVPNSRIYCLAFKTRTNTLYYINFKSIGTTLTNKEVAYKGARVTLLSKFNSNEVLCECVKNCWGR